MRNIIITDFYGIYFQNFIFMLTQILKVYIG